MTRDRIERLTEKLKKGLSKTQAIIDNLSAEQWNAHISSEPNSWTVKNLIAHFVSAEEALLAFAKDVVAGGQGAPEDMDFDAFNREELRRFEGVAPDDLTAWLAKARTATIDWVEGLDDSALDLEGQHPVLGIVTLKAIIHSIYAHQLLHMREAIPRLTGR